MRIIFNGRKVGNGDDACYIESKAYFSKRGLKKRTVLHELYNHLTYSKGIESPNRVEEKEANNYAEKFSDFSFRVSQFTISIIVYIVITKMAQVLMIFVGALASF